ncbi:MAG: hypothetical protein Kow0092_31290 [Deferrisomatales bacterium]
MSTQPDPLSKPQPPDRVVYALGQLLDEEDFGAEQLYHRGRLARALAYLHGTGTVAGLEVTVAAEGPEAEETLRVSAGLALDRLGRLIEVPRAACLRLHRWFEAQLADPVGRDRLSASFRTGSGGHPDGVVVDVFVKFEACERGKQPVFGAGGFDALDAVAPSRVRDAYRLELVVREEADPPVPDPGFPDLAGLSPEEARARVLDYKLRQAWKESTAWRGPGETLELLAEHVHGQDGTEVLLARLLLPALRPPLRRDPNGTVEVDNGVRALVFSTAELLWLTAAMR